MTGNPREHVFNAMHVIKMTLTGYYSRMCHGKIHQKRKSYVDMATLLPHVSGTRALVAYMLPLHLTIKVLKIEENSQ